MTTRLRTAADAATQERQAILLRIELAVHGDTPDRAAHVEGVYKTVCVAKKGLA